MRDRNTSHHDRKLPRICQTRSPLSLLVCQVEICSHICTLTRHIELQVDFSLIEQYCCIFAIWVHLKAGVSRDNTNIILKSLQFILGTLLGLIQIALDTQLDRKIKLPEIHLPQDIRTVFSKHFPYEEPKLLRTPCCSKCHTLYDEATMPDICPHQDSKNSNPCGNLLKRQQQLGLKHKPVPKTWFNTQDFRSWLEWFLSQREVEDNLATTFDRAPAAAGSVMSSYHDSPAWADLKEFRTTKYHLVFAFYIDWFNPYTNKIAGQG